MPDVPPIEGPLPEPDGVRCCVCGALIDWRRIEVVHGVDRAPARYYVTSCLRLPCGCETFRELRIEDIMGKPLRWSWGMEPDA